MRWNLYIITAFTLTDHSFKDFAVYKKAFFEEHACALFEKDYPDAFITNVRKA